MSLFYLFFSLFSSFNNVCDYIGKLPAKFVQNHTTIKNGDYITSLYLDEDGSFNLEFSCNGSCGPLGRKDPYTGVFKFQKFKDGPEIQLQLLDYNDIKKEPLWEYPFFYLEVEFIGKELIVKKGWRGLFTTFQRLQKSDHFVSWSGGKGSSCNPGNIHSCDRAHECNNKGQCITKKNVYPYCS